MLTRLFFNVVTKEFTSVKPIDADYISIERCDEMECTENKILALNSSGLDEPLHLHNEEINGDDVQAMQLFRYKNPIFMKYLDYFRIDNTHHLEYLHTYSETLTKKKGVNDVDED
jgi:hypothetical protein